MLHPDEVRIMKRTDVISRWSAYHERSRCYIQMERVSRNVQLLHPDAVRITKLTDVTSRFSAYRETYRRYIQMERVS
jgi:hypothetical protein